MKSDSYLLIIHFIFPIECGDLASNEMYYHTYNAINRKVDQNYEEQKWKKAQAFDQIINYIVEKENSEPGSGFFVQDLNTMYVENLFQNGTDEQIQTTRFTEILLSSLPIVKTSFSSMIRYWNL